jgi:hypothetical protein
VASGGTEGQPLGRLIWPPLLASRTADTRRPTSGAGCVRGSNGQKASGRLDAETAAGLRSIPPPPLLQPAAASHSTGTHVFRFPPLPPFPFEMRLFCREAASARRGGAAGRLCRLQEALQERARTLPTAILRCGADVKERQQHLSHVRLNRLCSRGGQRAAAGPERRKHFDSGPIVSLSAVASPCTLASSALLFLSAPSDPHLSRHGPALPRLVEGRMLPRKLSLRPQPGLHASLHPGEPARAAVLAQLSF